MQNLATANLVDAILKRACRSTGWSIGWIKPTSSCGSEISRTAEGPDRVAPSAMRTATDLEDAFEPGYAPGVLGPRPRPRADRRSSSSSSAGSSTPRTTVSRASRSRSGGRSAGSRTCITCASGRAMRGIWNKTNAVKPVSPSAWRGGAGSIEGAELRAMRSGGDLVGVDEIHTEHEDHPWTRKIPDHPPRTDSSMYLKSRERINELADESRRSLRTASTRITMVVGCG